MSFAVSRIDHAVYWVRDVQQSKDFYTRVLGLQEVVDERGACLLRAPSSDQHHDLGLFQADTHATRTPRGAAGRPCPLRHITQRFSGFAPGGRFFLVVGRSLSVQLWQDGGPGSGGSADAACRRVESRLIARGPDRAHAPAWARPFDAPASPWRYRGAAGSHRPAEPLPGNLPLTTGDAARAPRAGGTIPDAGASGAAFPLWSVGTIT